MIHLRRFLTGVRQLVEKFVFDLYVAGHTQRAMQASSNLRDICDQCLNGNYELRVIDVQQHPELAEAAGILVTPATVRVLPLPSYRAIGDLSDPAKVLMALGITRARPYLAKD
jgi:circadian clock protein KaiB